MKNKKKQLKLEIKAKAAEVELGLLELKQKEIPSKVESNMKDESVISCQKRRLFINLVKTMNYNCEKRIKGGQVFHFALFAIIYSLTPTPPFYPPRLNKYQKHNYLL